MHQCKIATQYSQTCFLPERKYKPHVQTLTVSCDSAYWPMQQQLGNVLEWCMKFATGCYALPEELHSGRLSTSVSDSSILCVEGLVQEDKWVMVDCAPGCYKCKHLYSIPHHLQCARILQSTSRMGPQATECTPEGMAN
jgi:hypothetical protein